MIEETIAAVTMISLMLYALMAGADFGGGIWDLFASGPRSNRQRDAIAHAIGPIWEANHVWLILVIVLLFTAWPQAYAVMMTALHIPITLVLVGIVIRGSVFVFRKYDSRKSHVQKRWNRIFGVASLLTPFLQGITFGALATGQIRVENGVVTTGFFAGWLTPFAIGCGLFATVLFAFLAAVYLTVDTANDTELQGDFRRRGLIAAFSLGPVAAMVFFTSKHDAPVLFAGLTNWWAPLLLAWTSLAALGAIGSLFLHKYSWARIYAIAQVSLILTGWGLAQFPYLVQPDITIKNVAAPEATLRLLVLALGAGATALLPSLYYLFRVFKGAEKG